MASGVSNGNSGAEITVDELFESAKMNLIPAKSKQLYLTSYEHFTSWQKNKNCLLISEKTLMAYFEDISKSKAPSTLWSTYSMLKKTIKNNNDLDISQYPNLIDLLKLKAKGFQTKKSKVLKSEEIDKFLSNAPDKQYLATKVALIIGIQGACRRDELYNITTQYVQDNGSYLEITLPKTKTDKIRNFVVEGKFYRIVKEYILHRPKDIESNKFFLNWQNGKCTRQVIGINKFGSMPVQVATFLNLPEPQSYTGHCFRRTSATLLADAGADLVTLKRHGGWKSNQVAEGYIEDSLENKRKISKLISNSVLKTSTTANGSNDDSNMQSCSTMSNKENSISSLDFSATADHLHITNCQNVTINIFSDSKK